MIVTGVIIAAGQTPAIAKQVGKIERHSAAIDTSGGLKLFNIRIVRGRRRTESGARRSYTLYYPQPAANLPPAPHPLVELVHGFLMTSKEQSNNARVLAQRGFVVITPNFTRVLLGDRTRTRNVEDALDFVTWLIRESRDKQSPYFNLVDPDRVAVGGNSSGGAVCIEEVLLAQKKAVPIKALISLDAVPWDRTKSRVSEMQPIKILSLRTKPSLCNFHGNVLQYWHLLHFKPEDVLLLGAHHCDAENPTTARCKCICGPSDPVHRALFARLLYLWLCDTMDAYLTPDHTQTFARVTAGMAKEHKVMLR